MKNNPYVGPRPYERGDRHNFYGRRREARELLALIVSERVVLFYAQSGAGKTSLLNARVIPALEEEGFNVLPVARVGSELPPGTDPREVNNVFVFSTLLALAGEETPPETLLDHTLHSFLEAHCPEPDDEGNPRPPVLILDQFEELFTTHRERWQDAQGFFVQMQEALDALPSLGVVFAMREDHLAALDPYAPLFPRRLRARFRMERLGSKGALAAVKRPAENAGCPFAGGVAERLVDDLRRTKVQRYTGTGEETVVVGPFVEPVQLQVVCNQLWANLPDDKDDAIQWEEVEQYGDIDRALTDFYESALAQVINLAQVSGPAQGWRMSERDLRRWFSQQLITPMGTRGLAMRGPETTAGLPNVAVDVLEGRHLIRADVRAGARWYELAHDRLVDPILQSNRAWEMARETPLRTTARRWTETEDPSLLYRGTALKEASVWAEADFAEVEPYEAEFLKASQQAEQERIRRRRRYIFAGGLGAMALLVILVLAIVAVKRERDARAAKAHAEAAKAYAEQQTRLASSGQLAAQAQDVLKDSPQRSLMLALEALDITLRVGEPRVPAAENALRQAISNMGGVLLIGHEKDVHTVMFSPDGRWLATASDDGTARLWDVSTALNEVDNPAVEPVVLRGHEDIIKAMAFSPDGRWLATGSRDRTARLWDVSAVPNTTIESAVLRGHEGDVWAVAFSPDGRWLATGSEDHTARLWDVSTVGTEVDDPTAEPVVLRGHEGEIKAVAFSPDGRWLATGSWDRTARLWEVTTGQEVAPPMEHEFSVMAVAFSPDGDWLATGSGGGTARLWKTHSPLADPTVLRGHGDVIIAMTFSPDSGWLATGSRDRTARLWEVTTGEEMIQVEHEGPVHAITFSPECGDLPEALAERCRRWLATGSEDGTARLLDLGNPMVEPMVLHGHEDDVMAVAFSPDGRWLATGSADDTAQLWEVDNPTVEPVVLRGHEGKIYAVASSPDGHWLATASEDRTVRLWDVSTALGTEVDDPTAEPVVLRGYEGDVNTVTFSPDGGWLATGSLDGMARLWDVSAVLNTGVDDPVAELAVPHREDVAAVAVAFSPDGRWLATWSDDGTVQLWEVDNPTAEPVVLRDYEGHIMTVAFSPDGRWLATASDVLVRLWDISVALNTGVNNPTVEPVVLHGHKDIVTAVAFSPDGRWLATGSLDRTIWLWDVSAVLDTTVEPVVLHGYKGGVTAMTFSPDGRWLATGSRDHTARMWDVSAVLNTEVDDPRVESVVLYGHEDIVTAVVFSLGGGWLATGSADNTAQLWEVDDLAAEPVVLDGHKGDINAVVFSPEGGWLATGSEDRTVRLWTLRLDELIDLACHTAGRNLSYEEWQWYLRDEPYRKTCPNIPVHSSAVEDMIFRAEAFALDGDAQAASLAYEKALQWADDIGDARFLNMICRFGGIDGVAEVVLPACERAIELEPNNEHYRNSRGLVYALMGDYEAAIEDLWFAVEQWKKRDSERYEPYILEREAWIAELEAGRDPFDAEMLDALRQEVLGE